MNTFFFGFLPLGIRRFLRSILSLLFIVDFILFLIGEPLLLPVILMQVVDTRYVEQFLSFYITLIVIIGLVSFVLKPFFVEDNNVVNKPVNSSWYFGYLSLKWRRLIRTIFLIFIIYEVISWMEYSVGYEFPGQYAERGVWWCLNLACHKSAIAQAQGGYIILEFLIWLISMIGVSRAFSGFFEKQ